MACEDTQQLECARPAAAAAAAEEVVVVVNAPESSDMAQVEKPADEKGQLSSLEPAPDAAEEGKPNAGASAAATTTEEEKITEKKMTTEFMSFKEEPNVADELPEVQKKALHELKQLIREALSNHQFSITTPITPPPPKGGEEKQLSPVNEGEKKAEGKEEKKEPIKTAEAVEEPPAVAVVVEEVVVDTVAVAETVDEDGTKTVEAIKETIVEVVSSVEQTPPPATTAAENDKQEAEPTAEPEEVSIWGIPLVADDERSDVVLLKFLRARDFRVKDAFNMIKNTVRWRKEFGIDSAVLEEEEDDLGTSFGNVVFMHGWDKQGHPVCYNVYGAFHNDKELYEKAFGDEETKKRFLKWRIQFLEKSIRKLDMSPHGVSTLVQVVDLRNSPGLLNRELRLTTGQALQVLQDNYPEFVAKQVFINVPWWYLAYNRMISPFLTQRTKSKFVFAGPSRTAETLFKYIAPEQVPMQYGGLSREGEQEFTFADPATEVTIKPATKHTVEFHVTETCLLVWEARVVGWDVSYGAEFSPSSEGSYAMILQKTRKVAPTEEPIISGQFKASELGKVVVTIENQSSKRKKLLYRSKTKACSEDQCPC